MAEADAELHHTDHPVDNTASEQEEPRVRARMPHNELGREQLDLLFPSIIAPSDEGLEDIVRDEDDEMLKHGMRIAAKISEDMTKHGRTRQNFS